MALAFLTFLSGLAISAIAIYYSVSGLVAIFSSAAIPIIIMGTSLEVSKLVAAWWLKANWSRAPYILKSYMLLAVIVLMLITSLGIFGFLSKAHNDHSLVTGNVQEQLVLIDEKIKIERDNIQNARALIAQLDGVVNALTTGQDRTARRADGSEFTISSAERALTTRRSQAKDRDRLTKEIEAAQQNIIKLQQQAAPIRAENRKVEAEVGPIKYIAEFVYGEQADQQLLEKSVTWMILTIIFVFDPLAVLLLLSSQMSFEWAKQEQKPKKSDEQIINDEKIIYKTNQNVVEPVPAETEIHVTPETHPYLFRNESFHKKPTPWFDAGPQVGKKPDNDQESEPLQKTQQK